jgi:hypothetical protein
MKYQIIEEWKITDGELLSLLPLQEISDALGTELNLKILRDDDLLKYDLTSYNMPIFTRAFNEDLKTDRLCRENIYKFIHSIDNLNFRDTFSISLPQALIYGNEINDEYMIGLHIAKIRKDELFINDIVLHKDKQTLLHKNLLSKVVANIKFLCSQHNIKYISGYAINNKVFELFQRNGFKADQRIQHGNDWLYRMSRNGKQIPFYIELS